MLRARRDVGVPVENHGVGPVTDHDLGVRGGTRLGECLLDADPGQPVSEVADSLLVGEVSLLHPAISPARWVFP